MYFVDLFVTKPCFLEVVVDVASDNEMVLGVLGKIEQDLEALVRVEFAVHVEPVAVEPPEECLQYGIGGVYMGSEPGTRGWRSR